MLSAPLVDDWRRFGDRRFRLYHYLALSQGVVGVLAGFDVLIPFALAIGTPPPVAVLLGVLPMFGGMAQMLVPGLLGRTHGNLRGLTILFAAIAEPRGFWYLALAVLVAAGLVTGPLAVVLLALMIALGSVLSAVSGANLLSWHSAVLPEEDRRLVVPRMMAVSLAIGALLLLPMAGLLDLLSRSVGVLAYALPLTLSGTLGVVEIFVLARLRHPGRVVVPPAALEADAQTNTELNGFLRISVLNALGMGFAPALSVYTISVVGLTAGFSMMVGSIGTLTQVATAVLVGSRLAHSSPDRHLRASFGIRAVAMACPIFALPGTLTAPLFLVASAMLAAIGYAEGLLAANERLFRLIRGPAVVRQHARYLGQTSGAMTIGQVAGAAAVSLGYPAFLLLYVISSGLRVVAYREAGRVTADQTADADHRSDQASDRLPDQTSDPASDRASDQPAGQSGRRDAPTPAVAV